MSNNNYKRNLPVPFFSQRETKYCWQRIARDGYAECQAPIYHRRCSGARHNIINYEEASEYFAKGTRPLYEAIKKGMRWESQVDLLLQYTTLDEDSLKAARESKDPAMIAKITRLWNEQNAGR